MATSRPWMRLAAPHRGRVVITVDRFCKKPKGMPASGSRHRRAGLDGIQGLRRFARHVAETHWFELVAHQDASAITPPDIPLPHRARLRPPPIPSQNGGGTLV